eukprot:PhF_6_TR21722/c0_g1_i1/m.31039/K13690/CMT1; alpha-1,3-mannosyltransferase
MFMKRKETMKYPPLAEVAIRLFISLVLFACIVILWIVMSVLTESVSYETPETPKELAAAVPDKVRVFFAMNFMNSAVILPRLVLNLQEVISVLGFDRVFVSVFASHSSDRTEDILLEFREWLSHRGAGNRIISDGHIEGHQTRPSHINRIDWLSKVRNAALSPLKDVVQYWNTAAPASNNNNDKLDVRVVFLNDIITTSSDILRLITANEMNYDIMCGLDLYWNFYDTWVARDIHGQSFSSYYPYVKDIESQAHLRKLEPFLVRSCWNGMVSMKAEPFLNHSVVFRSKHNNTACYDSECYLVCVDFRSVGFKDIYVHPGIVVAYEMKHYEFHHGSQGMWLRGLVALFNYPCWRSYLMLFNPSVAAPGDECLTNTTMSRHQSMWINVACGLIAMWLCVAYFVLTVKRINQKAIGDRIKDV